MDLTSRMAAAALLLWASPALAHLDVTSPTERSQNTANQKIGPCGGNAQNQPTTRNPANVQTFKPGAQIVVRIDETVNHTGYYRVAFDDDGQDIFKFPTAPGTPGHVIPAGQDGVLVPEVVDVPGQSTYLIPVTLPNIECDNCTLQVAQLMTEKYAAGAPWDEAGGNSIYYRCIDLTLTPNAPDPPDMAGVAVVDMAGTGPEADMGAGADLAAGGLPMGTFRSGCSLGGGGAAGPFAVLLLLFGALALRRKPRRASP